MRLPRLSSTWMRVSLAPALVFIATATDQGYLCDFWHHLARGRAMAQEGRLIDADRFTFTIPGQTFEDVNWLAQLAYYHAERVGGLALVQMLNSLVLAGMMLLLVLFCWRMSGSTAVAAAAGVFAFLGVWQALTIRPQTFSLFLFVLLYLLLDWAVSRRWLLLVAPPILALWANLHGAFPAGLMLVGAFTAAAVAEAFRRGRRLGLDGQSVALLGCLGACTLATLVNPYGWRAYHYVVQTSSVASGRPIGEWLPPSSDLLIGKFWVVSLLLVLAGFGLSRVRPTPREVCLVLLFLPMAAGSVRMVAWWALVTAPILARVIGANLALAGKPAEVERPAGGPALCFSVILLLVFLSVPGLSRFNPLLGAARRGPRATEAALNQVAQWMQARQPNARIFTRFEWSEYLTCTLGSAYPIFMDGRIEIYPDSVWAEYAEVTGGRSGWQEVLDHYHVDYLLLDEPYHAASGLLPQVQHASDWEPVFRAGNAVVYGRRQTAQVAKRGLLAERG